MSEALFYTIFFGTIFYIVSLGLISEIYGGNTRHCFDLKRNYIRWKKLNWFGVWFFTILYWIVFLPISIIYLVCWIFTVGRK